MKKNVNFYGDFSLEKTPCQICEISSERVNLLLGKKQKIQNLEKVEPNFVSEWFNTPGDSTRLTDGKYAQTASCYDEAFFHISSGGSRDFMYDLGCVCAVDGASVGLLREAEMGVGVPPRINVLLSEDGENWQTVAKIDELCTDKANDIIRKTVDFPKKYKARYVRFFFYVSMHTWIDQFEVYGCTDLTDACDITPDEETKFIDKFASTEELGSKDVLLAYICHKDVAPISKEVFLPHVAYMENGEIKDTLFDGYLFLPYVAFLYDKYTKRPLKKEDWQHYIDTQYTDGYNMDALEEAAKEVGKKLGKKDYKVSVYLSILYPVTAVNEFGIVDGRNLDFSKLEDRKAAIKWLIDEQFKRFNEKNYKHLELKGYYWFTEEISYSDRQLINLLNYTTDYVRSLGLINTWIPYYHASGYNDWQNLGFDIVCYQPNYAFNQNVPDERLFNAAEAAKRFGMCIELEVGGTQDWHIERIKKYYAAGAITGYMKDAAHMYYQGGVPGVYYNAYKSEEPELHSVYTDTYRFIKGTYQPDEIKFNLEEQ